jgi:hypothetical protein
MRRANRNNDDLAAGPTERQEADPGSGTSRRAVMVGAAAGLAGLVADSVISAHPAGAVNGFPVLLGKSGILNSAIATTAVSTTKGNGLQGATFSDGGSGVAGIDGSTAGGSGVFGTSTAGIGVEATISDPENSSPAMSVTNYGKGPGVMVLSETAASPAVRVSMKGA